MHMSASEGWKCPVCGKGVAPTEKTCDHGNQVNAGTYRPWPVIYPQTLKACPSCGSYGICGCSYSTCTTGGLVGPRLPRADFLRSQAMKWLALGLIAAGGFAVLSGLHMDSTSSFEGGTFIYEILLVVGGVVAMIVGAGIILVDVFASL